MENDYLLYDDSDLDLFSFIAEEVDKIRLEADWLQKEYFQENWSDDDLTLYKD